MGEREWQLAQINVARARAALTDPVMADFVAALDALNRLAEESPGFVWRLKAEGGGASSYIRFAADDRLIVNLSVWSSIESLHAYVYRSAHRRAFADRRRWFEPPSDRPFALWWQPAGDLPTVDDGLRRLERLRQYGPTPDAFTFRERFPMPG
jgi:uncharacterized protein DUF3291